MRLVREQLYEAFGKAKEPGWLEAGRQNVEWYIGILETLMSGRRAIGDYEKANIERLIDKTEVFDFKGSELFDLSEDEKAKVYKKLLTILKKELQYEKARDRKYFAGERAEQKYSKMMAKPQKLDISYEGSADKELLQKVIQKLGLKSKITSKSKIVLNAHYHQKSRWANDSVEMTETYADGYITIDNKHYSFEDLHVRTSGYDHFPPG